MTQLSKRLSGATESATLRLNAAVQALQKKGVEVWNLTAGEPDSNVPDSIKEAATRAIRENKSKYTPVPGIPELRDLIAQRTNGQQQTLSGAKPWARENVVVSNGAKQSIFQTLMAILDEGDEVIIPAPYWLSYSEMVKLCGGVPVVLQTSLADGFKLKPETLRSALTAKTKAFMVNSPCNPTGLVYSKSELAELAAVLRSHSRSVWVISDEIYDRLTYGSTPFCSFLEAAPELAEQTVTVNGLSKATAMTGWRVGWSVSNKVLAQAVSTLQGQLTSNINSVAQWASLAAFSLPESYFATQLESYRKRRDLVWKLLEKARHSRTIEVMAPQGAFYALLGVQACLGEGENEGELAERMLNECRVAVVPGTPFGAPGWIRMSFATDERTLTEGCSRLVGFLEQAKKR